MAETDRPCRCRSRIMTTSPSLITVPSPPAGRDSIDDRSAARPPGARPGRSTLTASLGKIQTALLGKITPASTGLAAAGYAHAPLNLSASWGDAALRLPAIHLVFGLANRWLLGTHHGAVSKKHLPAYLDE